MRRLFVIVFCLMSAAIFQPAAYAAAPEPADSIPAAVVVRFESKRVQAQSADGAALSLEDEGFRRLLVPAGMTTAHFVAELRANADVLSVDIDAPAYAAGLPDDLFYQANQASYLSQINAPAAWDLSTGSSSVVVAVLDTGLDINHPEFTDRLWENTHDATNDGLDDDGNGCINDRFGCRFIDLDSRNQKGCGYTSSVRNGAIFDDNGKPGSDRQSHGTLVSGIIGAAGNNGIGITGIAWNVKLMTVKVLDCGPNGAAPLTESMFTVAKGIDYARLNGAQIINLSLSSEAGGSVGDIEALRVAIQNCANQGIIVVAAAGNHAPDSQKVSPGYPAAYTQFPNLVAVGASNPQGGWATFSNYGPSITLAAPGVNIVGTTRTDLGSSTPYGTAEAGTSFAAPLVSGMFALMMARNPRLAATDYITVAKAAATSPPPAVHGGNWAGAGIINIGDAVARTPMSINGEALQDWKDVPNLTEVRATVNGTDCGLTKVDSFGPVARYAIRVQSNAEHPGCGAPGRTVQLSVGGAPASPTFTWGGRNESLALPNRDVSSVSPAPGAIVVQALNGSWSNIAALGAGGALPQALSDVPNTWNEVLRWDPEKPFLDSAGAYAHFAKTVPAYVNDLAAISQYDAIWLDGAAANVATLNPNPPPGRTIELKPGWNNFVYTGTAKEVKNALAAADGKYTQVLQYDNAGQRWLSYISGTPRYLNDFGGMFKFKVYWVYATSAVTITMN